MVLYLFFLFLVIWHDLNPFPDLKHWLFRCVTLLCDQNYQMLPQPFGFFSQNWTDQVLIWSIQNQGNFSYDFHRCGIAKQALSPDLVLINLFQVRYICLPQIHDFLLILWSNPRLLNVRYRKIYWEMVVVNLYINIIDLWRCIAQA